MTITEIKSELNSVFNLVLETFEPEHINEKERETLAKVIEALNSAQIHIDAQAARIAEQQAVIDQRNGECDRLINELAALREQEPVAGEAKFKSDAHWSPCTAAHVEMVLANPADWPNYEVRFLYAAPQPAPVAVPDELQMPELQRHQWADYALAQREVDSWNTCRAEVLRLNSGSK